MVHVTSSGEANTGITLAIWTGGASLLDEESAKIGEESTTHCEAEGTDEGTVCYVDYCFLESYQ